MAQIVQEFAKQFQIKEVNEDNFVFKLFSKVSFGLCLIGSILVATTSYFGDPIHCDHQGSDVDSSTFEAYCWIHGSKKIAQEYQEHFNCYSKKANEIADDPADNFTIYYQWVVFMLALNAVLFKVPRVLWNIYEGGIMKGFYQADAKSALIVGKEGVMRSLLSDYVHFYTKLQGRFSKYYAFFILCELLNIAILGVNFYITDLFLDGTFSTYGKDVNDFYAMDADQRRKSHDPMCNAFPTKVSCNMQTIGKSGQEQNINGLCILSQNIINEKIYLILWFWFVFVGIIGSLQILFEIAIMAIPAFRATLITWKLETFCSSEMKMYLERKKIGDWFLLYQIGKNVDREFYYNLIEELAREHSKRAIADAEPLLPRNDEEPLIDDKKDHETIEMDDK